MLPDDLILTIVENAVRDTPTALSLARVSKAVGRMTESLLYASITLRSIASMRTFTATLRTKNRRILAGITQLTLTLPAPRDFEDLWVLVGERCPHLSHMSLFANDLDSVWLTRLQPRYLRISFANVPAHPPQRLPNYGAGPNAPSPSPAPWGRVTHLSLPDHHPGPLRLLDPVHLHGLTHFSCFVTVAIPMNPTEVQRGFERLLALRSLRVCLIQHSDSDAPQPVANFVANFVAQLLPLHDRRVVVCEVDGSGSDNPDWEFAERKIAERR